MNATIGDYTVLVSDTPEAFTHKAKALVDQGWRPWAAPTLQMDYYAQAFVRENRVSGPATKDTGHHRRRQTSRCAHCGQIIQRVLPPRRNPPGVDSELDMSDEMIAQHGGGDSGWRHVVGDRFSVCCNGTEKRATPVARYGCVE